MTQEVVTQIITKAVTDNEFREQLLSKPEAALAGYELSEAERAALSKLNREAFDDQESEVEQRVSKVGLILHAIHLKPDVASVICPEPPNLPSQGVQDLFTKK